MLPDDYASVVPRSIHSCFRLGSRRRRQGIGTELRRPGRTRLDFLKRRGCELRCCAVDPACVGDSPASKDRGFSDSGCMGSSSEFASPRPENVYAQHVHRDREPLRNRYTTIPLFQDLRYLSASNPATCRNSSRSENCLPRRLQKMSRHSAWTCTRVRQHGFEIGPSGVERTLSHPSLGNLRGTHVANDDEPVFARNLRAGLMQKVFPAVPNFSVNRARPLRFACSLRRCQRRFALAIERRGFDDFAGQSEASVLKGPRSIPISAPGASAAHSTSTGTFMYQRPRPSGAERSAIRTGLGSRFGQYC